MSRAVFLLVTTVHIVCLADPSVSPRVTPSAFVKEEVDVEIGVDDDLTVRYRYSIGSVRVTSHQRTRLKNGEQVTRIRLLDGERRLVATCQFQRAKRRVQRTCALKEGRSTTTIHLAGNRKRPVSGQVVGPIGLELHGIGANSDDIDRYAPMLEIRQRGTSLGVVDTAGIATTLRYGSQIATRELRLLRVIALLHASLEVPEDTVTRDAPRRRPESIALSHAKDSRHAAKRRAKAQHGVRHGARLGCGVQRRCGMGAGLGGVPDNAEVDSGQFGWGIGVLLGGRSSLMLRTHGQFPGISFDGAVDNKEAPPGDYSTGSASFDLTFRKALAPDASSFAPVFGLSFRTRLLGLSYDHPDDGIDDPEVSAVSGVHLGMGVAPLLGLQWETKLDDGTRIVTFAEAYPEIMLWPLRNATDNTDGRLSTTPAVRRLFKRIGENPTFQVSTVIGVRFEM